jgi:hypothetical protein
MAMMSNVWAGKTRDPKTPIVGRPSPSRAKRKEEEEEEEEEV